MKNKKFRRPLHRLCVMIGARLYDDSIARLQLIELSIDPHPQ
jgi:hypothetical protein